VSTCQDGVNVSAGSDVRTPASAEPAMRVGEFLEIKVVPYDDPHSAMLIAEVQQEYVRRYGEEDVTPVEPSEFAPPRGLFLVGYLDDVPVACGGWRAHAALSDELSPGDVEMKRLYVSEAARGKGFARVLLDELERTATAAGGRRMVLETGTEQPEAIALYRSVGYAGIPNFGVYRHDPASVCFAKDLAGGYGANKAIH
jgi:GNAT superfamily N-acetyltransferase